MSLYIYDGAIATPELGRELGEQREFRRSTRAILKGAALMKKFFEDFPALTAMALAKRLAFVVGSSVGEIEITRDFLKELALTKTARPFLFQLSSHNSTAGFLAQHFGLRGPVLTVSNQYQSAESALEISQLLIDSRQCDAVLLFCVDQIIDGWMDLTMYQKYPQLNAVSGGSMVLLGREQLPEMQARAELADLSFGRKSDEAPPAGDFYDSSTLEFLISQVQSASWGRHRLTRPDQSATEFTLHGRA